MSHVLAMTMGDPAGIGLDVALAAWSQRRNLSLPPFVLFAPPQAVITRAERLGVEVAVTEIGDLKIAEEVFSDALPVVSLKNAVSAEAGRPDARNAAAIIESISLAVEAVVRDQALAIVTNPIAKSVLYDAGFEHPGHTEFLGALARRHGAKSAQPVMMIWSPLLAVVPVTIHVPLRQACDLLNTNSIASTLKITADDLSAQFGIVRPRLAVSGLNPHAGENGALGREELDSIAPAIARAQSEGVNAFGPLSADTMFHARARQNYDAAICMTHDQALIPAKTLAFDDGVNVTLGLPFRRVSPDHGTAFDIAGSGRANPASLIAALRLASRLGTPSRRF